MVVADAVEAVEEVEAKVEMENKAVETTNDAKQMTVLTYGRIVLAIEKVPATMVVEEEAAVEALVVDNMINSNHTTHSSIRICRLLLLLDKAIYHLLR